MIAALPTLAVDIGAAALITSAVVAALVSVARVGWVREQFRIRVTEPNRDRRREDIESVLRPMVTEIASRQNELDSIVSAHMNAEEGDRRAMAEQLGVIGGRLDTAHTWQGTTDERLDTIEHRLDEGAKKIGDLSGDLVNLRAMLIARPAEPRPFHRG